MYYPLNQWKPFCNGLWISSFDQETFKNCTFIFIQCIYNSFVLFIQHPLWSRFPPALAPHIAAVRKTKKSSSRPHNVMVNPMEALCALLSGHFSSQQWKRTWGAQGSTHHCFSSASGPTSRPLGLSPLHSVQWEKSTPLCHKGTFCKHRLERSQEARCGTGVVIKGDHSNKFPQNFLA